MALIIWNEHSVSWADIRVKCSAIWELLRVDHYLLGDIGNFGEKKDWKVCGLKKCLTWLGYWKAYLWGTIYYLHNCEKKDGQHQFSMPPPHLRNNGPPPLGCHVKSDIIEAPIHNLLPNTICRIPWTDPWRMKKGIYAHNVNLLPNLWDY